MKKMLLVIPLALVMLVGCSSKVEKQQLEKDIVALKVEKNKLEKSLSDLENLVVKEKIAKGVEKYVITIDIRQSHPFYDFENNIKDSMNAIDIKIPVEKEFYDSVDKGTIINDDFRMGSFVIGGSVGSWDVKISDKEIK